MSVDSSGCEPCGFHRETRRRARVNHTCGACRETIERGQVYVFEAFGGSFGIQTTKRCLRCELIYEHLIEVSPAGEFPDAHLNCGHTYEEVHDEPPPAWLAALAFWRPGDPLPATRACSSHLPNSYCSRWRGYWSRCVVSAEYGTTTGWRDASHRNPCEAAR